MTERVPTNEEVIEELTRDLEKSFVKNDDKKKEEERFFDVAGESTTGDDDKAAKSESEEAKIPVPNEEPDEYFVDEVALKDRDSGLDEGQQLELKNKANSIKIRGNALFQDGEYKEAMVAYTEALKTCPVQYKRERAILYANRAAARVQSSEHKESAIQDCTKAIEIDPSYVKASLRRARYYEDLEKLDEALADYKKAQEFDTANREIINNINRLSIAINERNEKLKTEMLDKLKDLGNVILKPFGLSTSNFQLQKDEASGGYSVKFNQNS